MLSQLVWMQCGCECLRCCDLAPVGGGAKVCRDATPRAPCLLGSFSGSCLQHNHSNCGPQYSHALNIGYCAVEQPNVWPALLPVSPTSRQTAGPEVPCGSHRSSAQCSAWGSNNELQPGNATLR